MEEALFFLSDLSDLSALRPLSLNRGMAIGHHMEVDVSLSLRQGMATYLEVNVLQKHAQ